MSAPSRRAVLAATSALGLGALLIGPARTGSSDAALVRASAEHIANHVAFNTSDSDLDFDDDPLWQAYERTRDALYYTPAVGLVGVLAKARAAKQEATNLKTGEEDWSNGPAETLAANIVQDLLRIYGGARA